MSSTERKLDAVKVRLPSLGIPYNGTIPDVVYIIPYTEAQRIELASSADSDAIDILLKQCLSGHDFDVKGLLIGDKNAILKKLRSITLGEKIYPDIECRKTSCLKKYSYEVDLEKMKCKGFSKNTTYPFKFVCEQSGDTIEYIILTQKQKSDLNSRLDAKEKQFPGFSRNKEAYRYVIASHLVSANGSAFTNLDAKYNYVRKMNVRDQAGLESKILNCSIGPDPSVVSVCPHCGHTNKQLLGYDDIDFFRWSFTQGDEERDYGITVFDPEGEYEDETDAQ